MRILIIDDDADLLSALRDLLTRRRYQVDCADSAAGALEMAGKNAYSVIFLDYKMPDHDGLWFMSSARLPPSTKVILMTAFVNREVINRMFAMGAAGYLIKPFEDEEFVHQIKFHTSQRNNHGCETTKQKEKL